MRPTRWTDGRRRDRRWGCLPRWRHPDQQWPCQKSLMAASSLSPPFSLAAPAQKPLFRPLHDERIGGATAQVSLPLGLAMPNPDFAEVHGGCFPDDRGGGNLRPILPGQAVVSPHDPCNNSKVSASSRRAEGQLPPTTPANRPQGTVVKKRRRKPWR